MSTLHEQARAEAEKRHPVARTDLGLTYPVEAVMAARQGGFVEGAVWAATRTREWSSIDPPPGWFTFGTHVEHDGPLEFSEAVGDDLMPLWERPATHPRVVTTVTELDALAVGSVVMAADDLAWQQDTTGWWTMAGSSRSRHAVHVPIPARVLYEPEENR